jgi:FAD/FMN-containing dehydrogenase
MSTPRSNAAEAAAVSRHLRSLGFRVLPSGSGTRREGVTVRSTPYASATIVVGLDDTDKAKLVAVELFDAIEEAARYDVRQNGLAPWILYVTKR